MHMRAAETPELELLRHHAGDVIVKRRQNMYGCFVMSGHWSDILCAIEFYDD